VNLILTARSGKAVNERREVTVIQRGDKDMMPLKETFINDPIAYMFAGLFLIMGWVFLPPGADIFALGCAAVFAIMAVKRFKDSTQRWSSWYEHLLTNWMPFTVLTFVAVAAGGLVQIVPTVVVNRAQNIEDRIQKVYTPLELAGRDIYVSEGCYNCHSQMIRTLLPDVLRYGDYSRLGESIFDHPFQWGSKRTGPDLARVGTRYAEDWHYKHMLDPRSTSPGSNMPAYPALFETKFDQKTLPKKIAVMTQLGVPYPTMSADEIKNKAIEQGIEVVEKLKAKGLAASPDTEIVALIAYLMKLGQYDTPEVEERLTRPKGLPFPLKPGNPDKFRTQAKETAANP
jgi:cytochrome c oxidase cbb3-type subunit I/II